MSAPERVAVPRWIVRLVLPLLAAELARVQVMARADARWAPEAMRVEAALRELRALLPPV